MAPTVDPHGMNVFSKRAHLPGEAPQGRSTVADPSAAGAVCDGGSGAVPPKEAASVQPPRGSAGGTCDGTTGGRRTGRSRTRIMQGGIRAIADAGGCAARYAVGDCPNAVEKLVVNDPTLRRPTSRQISATERSVVRSSAAARSSRRDRRYWCGDSPKALRNSRLKCAGDNPAASASAATESGEA